MRSYYSAVRCRSRSRVESSPRLRMRSIMRMLRASSTAISSRTTSSSRSIHSGRLFASWISGWRRSSARRCRRAWSSPLMARCSELRSTCHQQCRGAAPDPRTDIYALGCVGFELLLGEAPFRGALAIMFAAHLKKSPRVPSSVDPDAGIPRELDAVILRCLEKDPARRFQSGGDLCAALQGVPGYRPLRQPRG